MSTTTATGFRISQPVQWLCAFAALAFLAWLPRSPALFFALCAGTPVEFADADLDRNGRVTVVEAGYACNVDSRVVKHKGQPCVEYYSKADWRPIKLVCE